MLESDESFAHDRNKNSHSKASKLSDVDPVQTGTDDEIEDKSCPDAAF